MSAIDFKQASHCTEVRNGPFKKRTSVHQVTHAEGNAVCADMNDGWADLQPPSKHDC